MIQTDPVVLGYADRQSVLPGGAIAIKVSCSAPEYTCDFVRLRSPEVGLDAPVFTEDLVETPEAGSHPGSWQPIYPGSYVKVDGWPGEGSLTDVTVVMTIHPTLISSGRQSLICFGVGQSRTSIDVDASGRLAIARQGVGSLTSEVMVRQGRWTTVAVSIDAARGRVEFAALPVPSHLLEERSPVIGSHDLDWQPGVGSGPLTIGAALDLDNGREHPVFSFNGRIEHPFVLAEALSASEGGRLLEVMGEGHGNEAVADWDFSIGIDNDRVIDVGSGELHGTIMNLPTRGVGGSNWSGSTSDWRERPEEYGAIHFHEDDLLDAGWETSLTLEVPEAWESGCYAARLRAGGNEFYVPFVVRPPGGTTTSDVVFLVPTATYAAYANLGLRVTGQWNELIHGRLTVLDETDLLMLQHPDIGLSTYDSHSDGSTVVHSSMRRPVTNFRPKGRIYKFCQDLLIVSWLHDEGVRFDVVTDEDLDREGVDLISGYEVLITSSHPEYASAPMLDAVEGFVRSGGRLMYLGGNGFHHKAVFHPSMTGVVEVRRPDAPRLWVGDPSQGHHTFTHEPAGSWTGLGRPAQLLTGVAFVTQGFDECSYYRRTTASGDERARFIFDGVHDEIIGDFGILQGGAAGYEIDRADASLGTPEHALVLASSEGHSNLFDLMVVSLEDELPVTDPNDPDRIRADMVFFETPSGGAVFSVGSIAWSGSLAHSDFDNNVARVTSNVLERFRDPTPFDVPRHA